MSLASTRLQVTCEPQEMHLVRCLEAECHSYDTAMFQAISSWYAIELSAKMFNKI